MGACNQEERFWNFYGGVVTVDTRSVFFFSETAKMENFNFFVFAVIGVLG